MDQQDFETALLLALCAYAAYRLMKDVWPLFDRRKAHAERHLSGPVTLAPPEQGHQSVPSKYGSWKKTQVVNFGTAGMLLAWCYTATISPYLFFGFLGYLCIGFLVIRATGVPKPDDLAHLSRGDRFWLRIFHAWLWPIYALAARKR